MDRNRLIGFVQVATPTELPPSGSGPIADDDPASIHRSPLLDTCTSITELGSCVTVSRVRQEDGSIKLKQRARKLGSVSEYRRESDIKPLYTNFMQRLNAGKFTPESNLTLKEFVENIYLPFIEKERRASTKKGYGEISENHICDHVGDIRVREFRTVHASRMLAAIVLKGTT